MGNLASLTDAKDFVPYLDELIPMVHLVLVDPVPEARATAAKALGTLVERLGEIHFPDLVPGLLRTLKTDTSGVDRQGAAQGLSEVLSGLGMERLEGLLPDIVANARSPRPTVREGFMSSTFLPHLEAVSCHTYPKSIRPSSAVCRIPKNTCGRPLCAPPEWLSPTQGHCPVIGGFENGIFDPGYRIRVSFP